MPRVRIFGKLLKQDEIRDLSLLACAAGVPLQEITVADEIGDPTDDGSDDVILVLLTEAACEDAYLASELSKAPKGGRRAVCIWPKTTTKASVPPAAAKFSFSILGWDPNKLRIVLADDDATCFDAPDGVPLPPPETDHLECRTTKPDKVVSSE